jgi:hypothetical protein
MGCGVNLARACRGSAVGQIWRRQFAAPLWGEFGGVERREWGEFGGGARTLRAGWFQNGPAAHVRHGWRVDLR